MTAAESRRAQGLPPKVEDPAVLREAARLVVVDRRERDTDNRREAAS